MLSKSDKETSNKGKRMSDVYFAQTMFREAFPQRDTEASRLRCTKRTALSLVEFGRISPSAVRARSGKARPKGSMPKKWKP